MLKIPESKIPVLNNFRIWRDETFFYKVQTKNLYHFQVTRKQTSKKHSEKIYASAIYEY